MECYENNIIVVLTYTGVMKELQLSCENKQLQIESKDLLNDINWQKYRAHGLFFSRNRVFVGLVVHPSRMKDFAKVNQFMTVVMLENPTKNSMNILLNNQEGSLENYWDCLEMLRLFLTSSIFQI